jgi:kinesin family protein 5
VVVNGAEVLTMLSSNEIIATMQRGARNRMVAFTKSNDESSRGHAIFLITITKSDSINDVTQKAQLYLVDLAGSEKADKTGTLLSSSSHTHTHTHACGICHS